MPLWRNPKRQQIVICKQPYNPALPDYVKRVIGLPGETVDIHDGCVWIDGKRLEEPYTLGKTESPDPSASSTKLPYKVPENCYFVMGDNRGNSLDSRYCASIPPKNFIGTPVIIYISLDASSAAWYTAQILQR